MCTNLLVGMGVHAYIPLEIWRCATLVHCCDNYSDKYIYIYIQQLTYLFLVLYLVIGIGICSCVNGLLVAFSKGQNMCTWVAQV